MTKMKITLTNIIIVVSIFSCSNIDKKTDGKAHSANNSQTFNLESFPKNWIEIKQKDGKWVIFQPCDAAVFELKFFKENEIFFLLMTGGHETDRHKVEKVEKNSDGTLTIITIPEYDTTLRVTFKYKKGKDKSVWSIKYPPNKDYIEGYYIETKDSIDFNKVIQPCRECWDEEMCDEFEKNKKNNKP